MALMYANQVFPNQQPEYSTSPPVPVQQGIDWEPLLWTAGAIGLFALATGAFEVPPQRRCGTCGRAGHDSRKCSQNPAKRVRLR
jgi:hypothetical protein